MQKDIRKLLENFRDHKVDLSINHQQKMRTKLMQELHQNKSKKNSYTWLSVAASIVLVLGFSITYYSIKNTGNLNPVVSNQSNNLNIISLGNISPELNTIETYYTNSINYEISQLEITDDNKDVLDQYLVKIGELTNEYKSLTQELNKNGINDATIEALINNLQLRLQLLKRLKKQLNDFKQLNIQDYENQII